MTSPDTAIVIDKLSKRYQIGVAKERYVALRDVLTRRLKRLGRRMFHGEDELSPSLQDFWALREVSFEVKRGECVGIIGRNGAGKSTLLKILSRITEPTEGSIRLKGRVGSLLEVGTGFHPELTGHENIFLNGAILGMGRNEIARKFDEIVAFAEVEKFLDTPVKHYSSGMYTRLAFAVAAHLEPEILVVDEVLAVGDAQFQKKCLGKMGEVALTGRTVLFVSHNMEAVQLLCQQAVWLDAGRVKKSGPTHEILDEYLTASSLNRSVRDVKGTDLGGGVTLERLELTPRFPGSGQELEIVLELRTTSSALLTDLCLIIYTSMQVRACILDLRPRHDDNALVVRGTLRVRCRIQRLALVEGEYQLGLYAVGAHTMINITDLYPLSVGANMKPSGHISYASQYRGIAELEYSCDYPACLPSVESNEVVSC